MPSDKGEKILVIKGKLHDVIKSFNKFHKKVPKKAREQGTKTEHIPDSGLFTTQSQTLLTRWSLTKPTQGSAALQELDEIF